MATRFAITSCIPGKGGGAGSLPIVTKRRPGPSGQTRMETMKVLKIKGRFPGLNEYINAERSNRYKAAAMKKQCEHVVIMCARTQLRGFHPERVRMHYIWIEPDQRRDKDNISSFGRKVIQDGLVKAGVIKNDGWKQIADFSDEFIVDKKQPGIMVEIEEA